MCFTGSQYFILGTKNIIRTVSFKNKKHAPIHEDCKYEEDVCNWLVNEDKTLKSGVQEGCTNAKIIQDYLVKSPKEIDRVVNLAYKFVVDNKITHYVSKIHLGAAIFMKYSNASTTTYFTPHIKVGSPGANAEVGGGIERMESTSNFRGIEKGSIENVSRRNGEHVIEYETQPVFMLIGQSKVKEVIQRAIERYLQHPSKYIN